jgi:hypothetical protein
MERWEGRCCAKEAEAETETDEEPPPAAAADWERRTMLLGFPSPRDDDDDEAEAGPPPLVGDRALPYGRETALPSRARWTKCCCLEMPMPPDPEPEPEPGADPDEGGGDWSIADDALLCRCLSTMMIYFLFDLMAKSVLVYICMYKGGWGMEPSRI